jgi:hypothetical protein
MTEYTLVRHTPPYKHVRPIQPVTTEQYAYMCDLKRTLDATVCTNASAP